jgi:hypothetical protein
MSENGVPVRNLILVPAIITFAVTLLRLVGELQHWNPRLFNPEPGGGGALVGIAWLVVVFGIYFGWKLATLGHRPASAWRAAGAALLSIALMVLAGFVMDRLKLPLLVQLVVFAVLSWVAVFMTWRGWPALGRVLLAYAFAARIPVAVVMLAAILGNWGTHYDAVGPDFPPMGAWPKWFLVGFMPQFSVWIAYTVVLGMLFGLLGMALARGRSPQPAAA